MADDQAPKLYDFSITFEATYTHNIEVKALTEEGAIALAWAQFAKDSPCPEWDVSEADWDEFQHDDDEEEQDNAK